MAFVGICTALYDYEPQSAEELRITEGELLYVLEKSTEDSWWRAKKKAPSDEEEEPEGLVPNNYVEEATATHTAKALYDYQRQTEEELSFSEDDVLHVYDTSDPDWSLVGFNGEFGFVPANYIDADGDGGAEEEEDEEEEVQSPPLPARPSAPPVDSPTEAEAGRSAVPDPAANIASILGGKAARTPLAPPPAPAPESPREPSDEEEEAAPPPMPARPSAQQVASPITTRDIEPASPDTPGVVASPPSNRVTRALSQSAGHEGPGGYHLYNINEMVAVMGKMKKMPTTLGINLGMGVILVMPEKKRDGPQQEWAAENLTHYSIEGKHVFLELVKPSRSFDFHAGAKDTATEIVASLGELAGIANYRGLQDEVAKTPGQKRGQMLYDFMAQGDDEVTVADGDEVIILDDTLSEEWWKVRRVSNGKEGVVPSSYVEVTGLLSPPPQPKPTTPVASGMSSVERNRREEERITREAIEASRRREEQEARSGKRTARTDSKSGAKGNPDQAKLRTWTDRSGTFKVEAQFLGLKDAKIHLHKVNGVKIAVPIAKMSKTDIEYVERMTGRSLDDVKPLADVRANGAKQPSSNKAASQQPQKPEYDWFDFFLKCGVSPYQCERYSHNFSKDSMDESVLPDINPTVLRNLGLKEGDILRVMKHLDAQFNRKSKGVSFAGAEGNNAEGTEEGSSLFAGPGGALKNNRKGRPAPAVQTNDTIDSKLLERGGSSGSPMPQAPDRSESPEDKPPKPPAKDYAFEDNAWDVKPSKQQAQQPIRARTASPQATSPHPLTPKMTSGMQDITLLTQPLQPTKASPQQPQPPPIEVKPAPVPQQPSQQGASPAFFNQLNSQPTGLPQQQQATGFQFNPPRQRPHAPQIGQTAAMMAPNRPLSAPGASPNNPGQPLNQGPPLGVGYHMNSASPPPNMNQMQQMQQMQPMQTGFPGLNQPQQFQSQMQPQMQPQATGFQQQGFVNGQPATSPFANQSIQAQATGFQPGFQSQQGIMPQATGVNTMLPPALQPQPTAVNGFGRPAFGQPPMPSIPSQFGGPQQPQQQQQQQQHQQPAPPIPPIPQQSTPAPLQPQQTGPAPNVRFGMHPDAKKLITQPTGRRANLAQATPNNPFGF